MLLSNKTAGIIGGGQLAKLLALEGIRIGLDVNFWADENQTAINGLGDRFDASICSLRDFCQNVDVILIDYEHIPLHEIKIIEQFAPYNGHATLLRIGQDRLKEKLLQNKLSIAPNPYTKVNTAQDLITAHGKLGYPFILKKRVQGYDGIGQVLIKNEESLNVVLKNHNLEGYIAEKFVKFEKEYSLISIRGQNGEFKSYDLCENIHSNGILTLSKNISNDKIRDQAHIINKLIADSCQYTGVFAVEYFYVNDKLIINEISPRVHNSGHWTLDATVCNQFENHIRACLGLPLGSTISHTEMQMVNILGDFKKYSNLLKLPDAKFYNYNKAPRPNRKIGHINIEGKHLLLQ